MRLFFLTLCALSQISFAGDSAGNGDDSSELNFFAAYANLEQSLNTCVQVPLCAVEGKEKMLLTAIAGSLNKEPKAVDLLKFSSGKAHPEIFVINGQTKIAVTGLKTGTTIYINTDLLYPVDENGDVHPISIPKATAILIHELGHHQGETDHAYLDVMSGKVETFLNGRMQSIRGVGTWANVQASTVHIKENAGFTHFILFDGTQYFNLTQAVASTTTCDPLVSHSKPIAVKLTNIHWAGGILPSKQFLRARVEQICPDELGKDERLIGYSQIEVYPALMLNASSKWKISPKPVVREVICSQSPQACF